MYGSLFPTKCKLNVCTCLFESWYWTHLTLIVHFLKPFEAKYKKGIRIGALHQLKSKCVEHSLDKNGKLHRIPETSTNSLTIGSRVPSRHNLESTKHRGGMSMSGFISAAEQFYLTTFSLFLSTTSPPPQETSDLCEPTALKWRLLLSGFST